MVFCLRYDFDRLSLTALCEKIISLRYYDFDKLPGRNIHAHCGAMAGFALEFYFTIDLFKEFVDHQIAKAIAYFIGSAPRALAFSCEYLLHFLRTPAYTGINNGKLQPI